jgi:secreted trypsin-like serine protease
MNYVYKFIFFEKKAMVYALVFTIFVTFVSGKHWQAFDFLFSYFIQQLYNFFFSQFKNTGAPNEELGRIIGGNLSSSTEQFPYVVSISWQGQPMCGGFIYNDQWVVTAAECVHG